MKARAAGAALALAALVPPGLSAGVDDAVALYRSKHYAEAKAALEPLARAEPPSPPATYYLGMACLKLGGPTSLDDAHGWLGRAVKLAPDNADYLADYAGVCLLLADRDSSLSLAIEGRDCMTRAIQADPSDIDAREGLMRFYARAPWPLGEPDKAVALAVEISRRAPARAQAAFRSLADSFETAGRRERAAEARKMAAGLAPAPAK
jgi:tetratricopeptide (TPR) repeat protein